MSDVMLDQVDRTDAIEAAFWAMGNVHTEEDIATWWASFGYLWTEEKWTRGLVTRIEDLSAWWQVNRRDWRNHFNSPEICERAQVNADRIQQREFSKAFPIRGLTNIL